MKRITGFILAGVVLALSASVSAALILEDFESYSDTDDMRANSPLYMWAADGGAAVYSLSTMTANTGDQSVYCKLSPAGWGFYNVYGLRYNEGNGLNLIGYEKLSLAVRGSSSNNSKSVTLMKFQVADRFGSLIVDQTIDLGIAFSDDWTTLTVDIDSENWQWSTVRWIGVRLQRGQYHNPDIWLDDFKAIPEPMTLMLMGLGSGFLFIRRKS